MKQQLTVFLLVMAMTIVLGVAPQKAMAEETNDLREVDEQQSPFTDIPVHHQYFDIIKEMYQEKIINGFEDGTFRPLDEISRMHVAALLNRFMPLEQVREAALFDDVPPIHPYYKSILSVQQAGIVDGYNGSFNPLAPVTRVQMAKIIVNAFGLQVKEAYDFPDVPPSHWGNEYVRALYSNGITTGKDGYFNPNEPVSRMHFTVFLSRLFNVDDDYVAPPIEPSDVFKK